MGFLIFNVQSTTKAIISVRNTSRQIKSMPAEEEEEEATTAITKIIMVNFKSTIHTQAYSHACGAGVGNV